MSAPTPSDPKQWAEALRWLARADDDVKVIEVLIAQESPLLLPAAAVHCQQAAEKMAKAVLIASNVAPPRIHNIKRLSALVAAMHVELAK
jgi:HEPN domain-containing protein